MGGASGVKGVTGAGVEAMPQLSTEWRPVEQKGREEPVEL